MREIARFTSTNGRWGISVVGDVPDEFKLSSGPVRGTAQPLGTVEGHSVFRLCPDDQAQSWVLVGSDLVAVEGATVVCAQSLQSSDNCSILLLGPMAVVKSYGYKRRNYQVTLYSEGQAQDCPAPVLLALGLLPAQDVPAVQPPPPASSAFAEALRRAGLGVAK